MERDGDDGHDAADVGFGGWVGDDAGGDGEGEAAAGAAADGEEFAGVAAVAGGVLAGLGWFCVVSKVGPSVSGRLREGNQCGHTHFSTFRESVSWAGALCSGARR